MANIIKLGSSGGGSSTLITKSITANGTYTATDDNADGYSEVAVNVSGGGGLSLVSLANATQLKQSARTITISGNEIISPLSAKTNGTGIVTIPILNFSKTEFILEYSITTPSYTDNTYNARAFFSDTAPTNAWTTQDNYGYTLLTQSTTAWQGLMQRFEIPQGAQYFNIELGVTNFSSIKLWEE